MDSRPIESSSIEAFEVDRASFGGYFADAFAVLAETFHNPLRLSIVELVGRDAQFMAINGKVPKPKRAKSATVVLSPAFKLIFLTVAAMTIAAGA